MSNRSRIKRGIIASSRGVALFAGAFTALNLIGELAHARFDANLWWIDLRGVPDWLAKSVLALGSLTFVAFAFNKPSGNSRRSIVFVAQILIVASLFGFAGLNSWRVIEAVESQAIVSHAALPFSAYVAIGLTYLGLGIWLQAGQQAPERPIRSRTGWVVAVLSFGGSVLLFPFLQIQCFGHTDYRRPADVAVVLGCLVHRDGTLSMALADRVRTGAELYNAGLVRYLVMSGGPGEGDVHETEAMRRFAIELGVPHDRVLLDKDGLSTDKTVQNTVPIFRQHDFKRVLVVSHHYHLPRIKLTYHRANQEVFTVPARQEFQLVNRTWNIAREIVASWAYYLRPLTGV